jgi:hypothetical protein
VGERAAGEDEGFDGVVVLRVDERQDLVATVDEDLVGEEELAGRACAGWG